MPSSFSAPRQRPLRRPVARGGVVKRHGDHLVILRRGRLFTVAIGDRQLRPVASVDAYGPDVTPQGAWYDEMLVSGNTIVVIGYSYPRGGTEIGVFEIAPSGALAYKATYHLRSHDYYSSRNYASRLIGSKLVFYSPLYLDPYAKDPYAQFPAMRRWRAGATAGDFKRIAPATRIYRAEDGDPAQSVALHSVTVCDLAQAEMTCASTAVMGPPGRVFYVSPSAVFVWTTAWRRGADGTRPASALFRIPLDGAAPSRAAHRRQPDRPVLVPGGAPDHLRARAGRDAALAASRRSRATARSTKARTLDDSSRALG